LARGRHRDGGPKARRPRRAPRRGARRADGGTCRGATRARTSRGLGRMLRVAGTFPGEALAPVVARLRSWGRMRRQHAHSCCDGAARFAESLGRVRQRFGMGMHALAGRVHGGQICGGVCGQAGMPTGGQMRGEALRPARQANRGARSTVALEANERRGPSATAANRHCDATGRPRPAPLSWTSTSEAAGTAQGRTPRMMRSTPLGRSSPPPAIPQMHLRSGGPGERPSVRVGVRTLTHTVARLPGARRHGAVSSSSQRGRIAGGPGVRRPIAAPCCASCGRPPVRLEHLSGGCAGGLHDRGVSRGAPQAANTTHGIMSDPSRAAARPPSPTSRRGGLRC
jgi:hypothetical protein